MIYRAMRKDNHELIEGYYLVTKQGKHFIISYAYQSEYMPVIDTIKDEIIPETLAMSTGLTDKHNTMIFGSIEVDGVMSKGGDRVKLQHPSGIREDELYYEDKITNCYYESGSFWLTGDGISENCHFQYNDEHREIIGLQ